MIATMTWMARGAFCATVFADNIGHARHMVVAPNGVVYVNTWSGRYYANDENAKAPDGGFLLALQDTTGNGRADKVVRFGPAVESGNAGGTGIALYNGALFRGNERSHRPLRLAAGRDRADRGARGRRFGAAAHRRPSHASVQDRCAGRTCTSTSARPPMPARAEPNAEFSGHPAVHGARDAGRHLAL